VPDNRPDRCPWKWIDCGNSKLFGICFLKFTGTAINLRFNENFLIGNIDNHIAFANASIGFAVNISAQFAQYGVYICFKTPLS